MSDSTLKVPISTLGSGPSSGWHISNKVNNIQGRCFVTMLCKKIKTKQLNHNKSYLKTRACVEPMVNKQH